MIFLFTAPVLGWGRYETFEFGCTVAFHDQSFGVRSYVIVMLIFVLGIPLGKFWMNDSDFCSFTVHENEQKICNNKLFWAGVVLVKKSYGERDLLLT